MENHSTISRKALITFSIVGVIYPVIVILIELTTRMCSQTFFNPLPTFWHVILVFMVPLANGLLCYQLKTGKLSAYLKSLYWLTVLSIAIALIYSIYFLPILPLGVIAIIWFGIGLLPFAPVISLIVSCLLYRRLKQSFPLSHPKLTFQPTIWRAFLMVLLAICLLDLRAALTQVGIHWAMQDDIEAHRSGISLLQRFGDKDVLLGHSFSREIQPKGPLSLIAMGIKDSHRHINQNEMRELYYQVTGESFDSKSIPKEAINNRGFSRWAFDSDLGGTSVGSRIEGLSLLSSRIDGSVNADNGVAYLEWVLEFKNDAYRSNEARLQLSLPRDAVVSRATLWVNGEEKEAAFAGKAKVRAAYESVVRRNRDPLLVTHAGGDQILAQAFPILPNGGTIKFRLGMTVPLILKNIDQAQLQLPAIVDRNFMIGNVDHNLWIESDTPLINDISSSSLLNYQMLSDKRYRIEGAVGDKKWLDLNNIFVFSRDKNIKKIMVDGSNIVQEIVKESPSSLLEKTIMIVLDASLSVRDTKKALLASLDELAAEQKIGLVIATEDMVYIEPKAWSGEHAQKIKEAIQQAHFVGGKDNVPALAKAIKVLESESNAEILWIHGVQPIIFSRSQGVLDQTSERVQRFPLVKMYRVAAGANKVVESGKLAVYADSLSVSQSAKNDLTQYFKTGDTAISDYVFHRYVAQSLSDHTASSEPDIKRSHIARLWANEEVIRLMQANSANHDAAVALAAQYQLVTPVSGAVVLESQQQYSENNLTPVEAETVPTIPEPHQWLLIIIIACALLWYLYRNPSSLISRA